MSPYGQDDFYTQLRRAVYQADIRIGTTDNSLRVCDVNMRRWTGSSLVHSVACRRFGAKQLPGITFDLIKTSLS